jgi:hypothetical protein
VESWRRPRSARGYPYRVPGGYPAEARTCLRYRKSCTRRSTICSEVIEPLQTAARKCYQSGLLLLCPIRSSQADSGPLPTSSRPARTPADQMFSVISPLPARSPSGRSPRHGASVCIRGIAPWFGWRHVQARIGSDPGRRRRGGTASRKCAEGHEVLVSQCPPARRPAVSIWLQ